MANKYVRRAKADSSYKKLAAARKKNRNRGTSTSDVNEASAEDNRRYGAELAQRLNEGESYESAKKSAAQAVDTGQDVGLSNQRAQEAFDKERQANMQSVQADLRRRTLQSYGVTTIGSGTATEPPLARKTGVSPGVTVPYANVRGYMPGQPATVSVNYREQPPARTSQLSQIEKARLGFYEPEQTGVLGRANVAFKTFTEKKRDTIRSALGLRPVTAEDTARGRVMFSPVAYAERVEQNPPTTRLGKAKAFAGGAARGSLEYVTYRPATTGAFAAAGAVVGSLAASAAAVGVKTAVATKLVGSAAIGFYGGSVAASTIKEPNWARKGTIVGTEAVKFGALYSGSMVGRNVRFTYDKIAVKTGEPTVTKTLTGYKVNVPQKVLYRGVGVAAGDKGTALVGRTSTGKVTVGNKVKLDFKGVKGSFIFETPGATKIGMYNVKRLGTPGTYGQLLNIQAVGDATRPVSQSQIDKLYSRQLPISTKTVTASGQRYVYADVRGRGKIIYGSAATSNLRATYPKGMKVYTKIPKRLAWKTPSDTDTVKWIARSTNVKQLNRLSTNLQRTGNTARVKKADAVLQTRSKGRWKTAVDSKDIVDIDTGFRSPDVPTSYSFGKRVDLGVIGQRSPFIGGGVKTITPREQLLLQLSSLQTLKVSGGKISLLNDASRSKDVFKAFQLSKAISKAGGTRVQARTQLAIDRAAQYYPQRVLLGKVGGSSRSLSISPVVSSPVSSPVIASTAISTVSRPSVPRRFSRSLSRSVSRSSPSVSVSRSSISPSASFSRSPSRSSVSVSSGSSSVSSASISSSSVSRSLSSASSSSSTSSSVSPIQPPPGTTRLGFFLPGAAYVGGAGIGSKKGKGLRQYNPSVFASVFKVKGKPTKIGTLTGLGVRPI